MPHSPQNVGNRSHTGNFQTQNIQAGSLRKVTDLLLFVMTEKTNEDMPKILNNGYRRRRNVCIRALAFYVA
jgi:hypothetical protein